MDRTLKDAELKKSDIDEVLLVGGSTRIPRIRQMLKRFFNGKEPNASTNPDEVVACGAALQAVNVTGDLRSQLEIVDLSSLSLGTKLIGRGMKVMIERNIKIPISRTDRFWTRSHNQSRMTIAVYEGERARVKDNRHIGTLEVDIPKARKGQECIDVTFNVDENGLFTVTTTVVVRDNLL